MQFFDEVTIMVRGGAGGDGCVAFRREAHVPRGGPSGGDGGHGGSIILEADSALSTLLDLRYQKEYRAPRGEHGQGHDRFGKQGEDLMVKIPCGTLIFDKESGELLADVVTPGQRFVAACGGRGGRGNIHFTTSTNRAPRRADPGEPGEERKLRLELKLLADVGLVGLPNAGKSTLISHISAAHPKIADYPFTTLIPCLGVVNIGEERTLVVADIPGLIKGAHEGLGLGHRFLRHIERTFVLVYLIDDRHALNQESGTPLDDFRLLQEEIVHHDADLAQRPFLVAFNKIDLVSPERMEELSDVFAKENLKLCFISGVTGKGIRPFLEVVWDMVKQRRTL